MSSMDVTLLIVAGLGLMLAAFAGAVAAALGATSRWRDWYQDLEGEKVRRPGVRDNHHRRGYSAAATTLVATTLGLTVASWSVAWLVARWFGPASGIAALLGGAVMAILALVVGQAWPRTLGLRDPAATLRWLRQPLGFFVQILNPLVDLLRLLSRPLAAPPTTEAALAEAPFLPPLAELSVSGPVDPEETHMIEAVFELDEKTVREIMVPRPDIAAVPATADLMAAADLVLERGFSRIPVYEGDIDHIIGIVYAKDILRYLRAGQTQTPLRGILRSALFVPLNKRVDDLLQEMRTRRTHMAIVLDEYGGTAGLVTIEDLLEVIVGEIQDEYDTEPPLIETISEDEWIIAGKLETEALAERIGMDLESDNYETVGGLLNHMLGRAPLVGDEVRLGDYVLTILSTSGKRVTRVRLKRLPQDESAAVATTGPNAAA